MTESEPLILEFTPRTLQQLVAAVAARLTAGHLPVGLVRVTGRLSDPGPPSGNWHYRVALAEDGGARIHADIPADLVTGRRLAAGQWVSLTGPLRLRTEKLNRIEIRLEAGAVGMPEADGGAARAPSEGPVTVGVLKGLPAVRRAFPVPESGPLSVAIVRSEASEAKDDCLAELQKLGPAVALRPRRANMIDPVSIAAAIGQADADVLIVMRGGGDAAQFDVFDDPRVIRAFAGHPGYRIAGLGHSGNTTLCDFLADFSAPTPAQAGQHVREAVERENRRDQDFRDAIDRGVYGLQKALDVTQQSLAAAEQALAAERAKPGLLPLARPAPWLARYWWAVTILAFVAGLLVARLPH